MSYFVVSLPPDSSKIYLLGVESYTSAEEYACQDVEGAWETDETALRTPHSVDFPSPKDARECFEKISLLFREIEKLLEDKQVAAIEAFVTILLSGSEVRKDALHRAGVTERQVDAVLAKNGFKLRIEVREPRDPWGDEGDNPEADTDLKNVFLTAHRR